MSNSSTNVHAFSEAQNVNAQGAAVNVVGRDQTNIYHNAKDNTEVSEKLKLLKPVEKHHYPDPCMEGTRSTILERIQMWLQDFDEATPNVMWITGSPGTGKSAIASRLVETLNSKEWKRLGASHFFKRDDNILCDPTVVWRTMAEELVSKSKYSFLKSEVVEQLDSSFQLDRIEWHFKHLIAGPLVAQDVKLIKSPPVFIIDALDECTSLGEIEKTFEGWTKLPKHYKLILTGRPGSEPEIVYENQQCIIVKLETDSNLDPEINRNIYEYLKYSFKMHEREIQLYPQEREVEQLTDKAGGLFIWAATAMKYITADTQSTVNQLSPKQKLDQVLSGGVSNLIDNLYGQILQNSFGMWSEKRQKIVVQILAIILLAKTPLPANELKYFLDYDRNDCYFDEEIKRILFLLQPLTIKVDNKIMLHHSSFAEYLMKNSPTHKISVNVQKHTTMLLKRIFGILNNELKFNICRIGSSYMLNKEIEDLDQRISECLSVHLQYCCRYWSLHYVEMMENMNNTSICLSELRIFMYCKFLYWLEVMSILNEMELGQVMLNKVANCVGENLKVFKFIVDGIKFVSNFVNPIAQSSCHIYLSAIAFSPEKSLIAKHFLPCFSNVLKPVKGKDKYWNATVHDIYNSDSEVTCVSCSSDGTWVVFGGKDGIVRLWNIKSGQAATVLLEGHSDGVTSVAFSLDGNRIVSGSHDKTVRVWNTDTKVTMKKVLEGHGNSVKSVAFSPDGALVVSGSGDKTLRIWDINTGQTICGPLYGHNHWVTSVAFSPDGAFVVSGSADKTLRVWDISSGKILGRSLHGHIQQVTSVAFSPDGAFVVSASEDETISIWNVKNGKRAVEPILGHIDKVASVAFSPDGKQVVSGSFDRTVKVWNMKGGKISYKEFSGHTKVVTSVAFSSATQVISGSLDKTVRIWNIKNGMTVPEPGGDSVASVKFSPGEADIKSKPVHFKKFYSFGGPEIFASCMLDGWVKSDKEEKLFWVPAHKRKKICSYEVIEISPDHGICKIDLTNFVSGDEWTLCQTDDPTLPMDFDIYISHLANILPSMKIRN